jgi:hypothetical protein
MPRSLDSPAPETRAAAERRAAAWERGRREHDAAEIAAPEAPGASRSQHPFRERGPTYLERVAEQESASRFDEDALVVGHRDIGLLQ